MASERGAPQRPTDGWVQALKWFTGRVGEMSSIKHSLGDGPLVRSSIYVELASDSHLLFSSTTGFPLGWGFLYPRVSIQDQDLGAFLKDSGDQDDE